MENKNQKKERPNSYLKYSSLGFQMVGSLVLAAWVGIKLDEHFHVKAHLFTIFLMLFAVVGSLYMVVKDLLNGK